MNPEPSTALTVVERFFDDFPRGEQLLIVTHNHPDPDAISSAAALREISMVLGEAKTTLAYGGIIGRSENAHMVKYLNLQLKPMERIRLAQYKKIALVDTQPGTGNNSLPPKVIPDLVIDHHPIIRQARKCPYLDVREGYGATATIVAQYLFQFGLPIEKNLATALLYGIKSETQDLGREAHAVDIESYLKLFPIANKRLLAKIVNARVPQSYFYFLKSAIENAYVVGNAVITRLSDVENPDMIPEFADLMLRLEKAVWAFTMGDYKDTIYLSIRTTNVRKNAGLLMKQLVRGKGSGGGHGQIAGGKVQVVGLERWKVHELEDEIERSFLKLIHREGYGRVSLAVKDTEEKWPKEVSTG